MPRKKSIELEVTEQEKILLSRKTKHQSPNLREALRAEIVLRAASGQTNYYIAKDLGVSRNTVKLWRYRFARQRVAGLQPRPIPGRPKQRKDSPYPTA